MILPLKDVIRVATKEDEEKEARKVLSDAKEILVNYQGGAVARVGIFPANSVSDDIEIYSDEKRDFVKGKLCTLRQQKVGLNSCLALADFIAPKGTPDYIGAFALTTGLGLRDAALDDYSALVTKLLANVMAEALAEKIHSLIREKLWGCDSEGIRPASGYPTCPDHSDKALIFNLLQVSEIKLTENYAMAPEASIAGWFFMHPEARYFDVGRSTEEQLTDYASRKCQPIEVVKHNLGISN